MRLTSKNTPADTASFLSFKNIMTRIYSPTRLRCLNAKHEDISGPEEKYHNLEQQKYPPWN